MLNAKQQELESLRESLAQSTQMGQELKIRCEVMALWSGRGKTIGRIQTLKMRCFSALKQYKEFKKHSQTMLEHRSRQHSCNRMRRVF